MCLSLLNHIFSIHVYHFPIEGHSQLEVYSKMSSKHLGVEALKTHNSWTMPSCRRLKLHMKSSKSRGPAAGVVPEQPKITPCEHHASVKPQARRDHTYTNAGEFPGAQPTR